MPLLYCVIVKILVKYLFGHHLLSLALHVVNLSSFWSNFCIWAISFKSSNLLNFIINFATTGQLIHLLLSLLCQFIISYVAYY